MIHTRFGTLKFATHLFYFLTQCQARSVWAGAVPRVSWGEEGPARDIWMLPPISHPVRFHTSEHEADTLTGLASSHLRNVSRKTCHRLAVFPTPNGLIVKKGLFLIYPGGCGGRETPPFHLGDNKLILHYN